MDFSIIRVARTVMNVTDLDRAREFYVDALGFIETESDDQHIYLRGLEEHCHHSLVLKKAEKTGVHAIGYKVQEEGQLESLEKLFQSKGLKTKWMENGSQRAIGKTLRVHDVSGIPLEFFTKMETVERMLQRYEMYKGARIQRIDHVNCQVPDVEKAYDFYVKELGFACSEYTETEDDKKWAAWLHRKQNVHDQAFMNGEGPRLHHIGFWLSDPLSIIHACDVLASLGYGSNIERGPGRHGLSNAFFLYLRDPDGNRIELYNGDYLTSDPDFKPIRWDINDPRRQTFWGHKAPDSWFEEATPFLDIETGEEVEIKNPTLKQRKPEFVI
ncbi:3,4-dihydroxyphenylacetate 2,3-dioxygenase [Effusibacillus dendaii]|uniref:3,4-dihydroxyphenylacetate 2,3-dioxygenase n=1 Tax=Effusibacillus dendaii TaxID=2743772 RepID=A0A7I8D878_9BACL|nr:3,4-dihydroxyphenylacetate 2,3-dioxygenase [Effusibacillus dendaii]BCJ85572.1 3,4-dihydroxyphenylacetate 2,3-dioxygenase [Effusibacillus dendaii]